MGVQDRTAEQVIGRLATTAHGVVTRACLLEAGLTAKEIERRLRTGALIREHRGVYRVGHRAPSIEAGYMAAVLACGDRALLSGRAAGYLFEILKGQAPLPEVTAPTERRVKGVKTKRSRRLGPQDGTRWKGIPVTTVPRTLVDLSSSLSLDALARACHEAGVKYGTTPRQVEAILAGRPTTPGAKKLKRVMHGDANVTLSVLERRFLQVLEQAGLPLPQTNRSAGGGRVDCRWPEKRLTVELDGYRYHSSRHAWERDRRREREAYLRGDDFRRYTHDDVMEHPRLMLAELRPLLSA